MNESVDLSMSVFKPNNQNGVTKLTVNLYMLNVEIKLTGCLSLSPH